MSHGASVFWHLSLPQELVDLMQDCMSLDVAQRPTAQQALQRLQELAHGRNPRD